MPKSTPSGEVAAAMTAIKMARMGGYPSLKARHDFARVKASPAGSESLKPEIGRCVREMEEESRRIDVDFWKIKRGDLAP